MPMNPEENGKEQGTAEDSAEMRQGLIPHMRAAGVAVGLTSSLTALSVRAIGRPLPVPGDHWLLRFHFLPYWAQLTVNSAFYGYLVFLGISFFRLAQGRERVVVVGSFLGFLFYPFEPFVAPPAVIAMRNVSAAAHAVALLAALDIFLRTVRRQRGADSD